MFTDYTKIMIKSGNGGNGAATFRREKYVPLGGPYGGNGGRGSNIIFKADEGLRTLIDLRYNKIIKGERGENGMGKNCNGKGAKDIISNNVKINDAITMSPHFSVAAPNVKVDVKVDKSGGVTKTMSILNPQQAVLLNNWYSRTSSQYGSTTK